MSQRAHKKILGIDPGFADTGFGIISQQNNKFEVLDYGSIKTAAKQKFPKRIAYIYQQVNSLIKKYRPDYIAVEKLFFHTNVTTAINVGQARGVVLLAAEEYKIPIYEYTPLQVKQALTGYGAADKKQLGQMVKSILNLDKIPRPDDASDALAVAICCFNSLKIDKLNAK